MKRERISNSIVVQDEKVTSINNVSDLEVGQWYWVKNDGEESWDENDVKHVNTDPWLACVSHIGSNYIKLKHPATPHGGSSSWRIHFDDFFSELTHEPNAEQIIKEKTSYYQAKVQKLLGEVKAITARLGVSQQTALPDQPTNEQNALVVLSNQNSIKDYESALILAKDKQLPDLFKDIKHNNEQVFKWLSASSLPLEALIKGMEGIIGSITDKVFNVSLYAGLTEQVILCKEGEPAAFHEKLHIMQRRLYMDEECLLNYRHGGMTFKSIEEFDQWVSEPENRDRIMPFPRTLVAMRVRRLEKERKNDGTLQTAYINIRLKALDNFTFLYIRNGEQIYRLNCDLDFDEMIFPDRASFDPTQEKMMNVSWGGNIKTLISKGDYDERVKKQKDERQNFSKWIKDNPKRQWIKENREEGATRDRMSWLYNNANPYDKRPYSFNAKDWKPFNPSCVYYDDATKIITDVIKKYNRIALIVQGLYDRSPVLHPHPSAKLWSQAGFDLAVKLIYDGENALYEGVKPDFEAYREKCNESMNVDSIVIGQELFWMKKEADKEYERQCNGWRCKNSYHPGTYTPYGNEGPGYLAKMPNWMKRVRKASFRWKRERLTDNYYNAKPIICNVTVPVDELFNVSAYKPGDFKQFFQDPRTRAEYLKWAPMLLTAEEYHAGNEEVKEPVGG